MKATTRASGALLFAAIIWGFLSPRVALAHKFGDTPYDDIIYAAENYNLCPEKLSTEMLVAYMLSPTWWELTGGDSSLLPSPMTLSRGDNNSSKLYPDNQSGLSAPHRRAFWHPGIGLWQLDEKDGKLGQQMSIGRFNTWDGARRIAMTMSERYCKEQTPFSVFGPWCGCAPSGTCAGTDRSLCQNTFNKLYNPDGPPEHLIERDDRVGRHGGAEVRTCRLAGQLLSTFVCIYVDPARAEGTTSSWIYSPIGVSIPGTPSPLSKPFYVYKEGATTETSFEWRYWLDADTGFGRDYAARRAYGSDSRTSLEWFADAATSLGLCDLTTLRGSCGVCAPGMTSASASCSPQVPLVSSIGATSISEQSVSLNLSVDPNGSSTSVWFEWGTSLNLGQETLPHRDVGRGTSSIPVSVTLAGLICNTTYYFSARARNTSGHALPGETLSFKTNSCSDGGTQSQELITNGSFESGYTGWIKNGSFFIDAQPCPYSGSRYAFLALADGTRGDNLSGTLEQIVSIPQSATSASLSFRYSISTNEPGNQPQDVMTVWVYNESGGAALQLLDAFSNVDAQNGCGSSYYDRASFDLSGYAGQTIRLRFFATTDSRSGTPTVFRLDTVSVSAVMSQVSAADVATGVADQVTASSARLNMLVNPNHSGTTIWFDLEAGDPTPDEDTERISIGGGSDTVALNVGVFDLSCGTTYYFRANAENTAGASRGDVHLFTTASCDGGAPAVATKTANDITQNSATLSAEIDPNGFATDAWFAWGDAPDLTRETPPVSIGAGNGRVTLSHTITGLVCGTTYSFQSHAQNVAGYSGGSRSTFTTSSCGPGPSLPLVTASAIDDTASESGLDGGAFRVSRTGSNANVLNIGFTLTGTAASGVDYENFSGISIPAGSSSVDVVVQPRQDSEVEPNETVILTLVALNTYNLGTPASATVTITSDDGGGECYVSMLSPVDGDTWIKGVSQSVKWTAGPGCAEFGVRLEHSASGEYLFIGNSIADYEFDFIPAAWLVPGSDYQLKVVGFDSTGTGSVDTTAASTINIVNPSILPSVIFEDDVEDGARDSINWSSYGWGVTGGGSEFSHSPINSHSNIPAFFATDVTSYLLSPRIDLSGRQSLILTFWQRFAFANFWSVQIWIRDSEGGYWHVRELTDWHADWRPVTIDLSRFLGEPFIQLSFESYTPNASNAGSWYVDDIKLYEPRATDFYTLPPCRVVDTRQGQGALVTGSPLARRLAIAGVCGIPSTARAASFNVTVANPTGSGHIKLFPADQEETTTSTLNFSAGQNRANNAIVSLSGDGHVGAVAKIGTSGQTDLVLDVNGYFADSHPLVGLWEGTIAGYVSSLRVGQNGEALNVLISMHSANEPQEQLEVVSFSEKALIANRPLDGDAQLRLTRVITEAGECLVGEYFETGAGRPISLCRVE